MSGQAPDYLFGQSAAETERLRLQAKMFAPYTARFLVDAGISRGMKVLDVGTGASDVALLAAELVRRDGTVVGIDFNPELIATAQARVSAEGFENVSFVVGDAASAELDGDFDAVVGRCVLFFAREPASLVRRLTGLIRAAGSLRSRSQPTRRSRRCPYRVHSCWSSSGCGSLRPTAAQTWTCTWVCGCAVSLPRPGSPRR
jgi:2-polyprenyl-3-methyl-5-hydroxy-6-metoxy-1,4-benzoquinol methylase